MDIWLYALADSFADVELIGQRGKMARAL